MVENPNPEHSDGTNERLAEMLPFLQAVVFTKENLAITYGDKIIHILPPPGNTHHAETQALLQGEELATCLKMFAGFQPANPDRVFGLFVSDIGNSREDQGLSESISWRYPDRPRLTVPKGVSYPDEICPILNAQFAARFKLGEKFMVITSQLSPACIWIVPENPDGKAELYPKKIAIEEGETVWIDDRKYVRYEYFAGIFAFMNYYTRIDSRASRIINLERWKHQNQPPPDINYIFTDNSEPVMLPETHDHMDKKKECPQQTREFKKLMYRADYEVRSFLNPENITDVIYLTSAIHRSDQKNGREQTRKAIQQLREAFKPFIKSFPADPSYCEPEAAILRRAINTEDKPELKRWLRDIHFDLSHSAELGHTHNLTADATLKTFLTLFNAESCYLNPIYNYPWNNQGPEPFEALIDVLWFRYDYYDTAQRFESYKDKMKDIKTEAGKVYKNAWLQLKSAYVTQEVPEWELLFSTQENVPVTASLLRSFRSPRNFINQYSLRNLEDKKTAVRKEQAEPLGLTKLLWSVLKWAQPRPGQAISLDGLDYDPEIADEHRPDTRHTGDLQGRTMLAGEEYDGLTHLTHEETADPADPRQVLLARLFRAVSEYGTTVPMKRLKKIADEQINLPEPEWIPARETAREFKQATKKLTLEEIIKTADSLPLALQTVIYTRLGFNPRQLRDCGSTERVENVIRNLFYGNEREYYRMVYLAALKLSGDTQADLLIQRHDKEIQERSENMLKPAGEARQSGEIKRNIISDEDEEKLDIAQTSFGAAFMEEEEPEITEADETEDIENKEDEVPF